MFTLNLPPLCAKIDLNPDCSYLPDPHTWLQHIEGAHHLEEQPSVDLFDHVGVPSADLYPTLFSARASLMGMGTGHAFAHHELRHRLAMPPELKPEVKVWDKGTTPQWVDGIYTEPKYFSFFQEAPIHVYNPNHRRKWRSHELLHGAQAFYWHPEMSRFQFYIGARLNELLPVVHWYAFDEIFRPRCPLHRGKLLYREHCIQCDEIRTPFWKIEAKRMGQMRKHALSFLIQGLEHFKQEFSACLEEVASGKTVEVLRPRLDASSDAVGYLRAHWNRVTSWSFGTYVELMLTPGIHYQDNLESTLLHTVQSLEKLLSGSLSLNSEDYLSKRRNRIIMDLSYRALLFIEGIAHRSNRRADQAEASLMPLLELGAGWVKGTPPTQLQLERWIHELDQVLNHKKRGAALSGHKHVLATGYQWSKQRLDAVWTAPGSLQLLSEGIESAFPILFEHFAEELPALITRFHQSDMMTTPGTLASRFSLWLSGLEQNDMAQLAHFESKSKATPTVDEAFQNFGVLPSDNTQLTPDQGELRLNQTFRVFHLSDSLQTRVFGEIYGSDLVGIIKEGELQILSLSPIMLNIIDVIKQGAYNAENSDRAGIDELLENGILVWLPRPTAN